MLGGVQGVVGRGGFRPAATHVATEQQATCFEPSGILPQLHAPAASLGGFERNNAGAGEKQSRCTCRVAAMLYTAAHQMHNMQS
jgi:hypothetical protein